MRSEKDTKWQGAFRVPEMIRWPSKIEAGVVSNEIIQHHDWLPTFLAAAVEPDIVEKVTKHHKAAGKDLQSASRQRLRRMEPSPAAHSLELFQEGRVVNQHLDFRVWFDRLTVHDADGRTIELSDFAEGGVRWSTGLRSGDARATKHGIFPLKGDGAAP